MWRNQRARVSGQQEQVNGRLAATRGLQAATRGLQATHDDFFDDLLHTGVIVSTSSTSEWPVTSVLGLRREETRINYGFRQKKKKNKLYGGKRWCSSKREVIRWL